MAILFRVTMMFAGYIWACIAASLVLTIGTLLPEWDDLTSLGMQSVALWSVVAVGAAIIAAVAMLPTFLVIALTEGFALRSIIVYGALGGALALAMSYGLDFFGHVGGHVGSPDGDLARGREIFAAAGIAGGLVYWLFAGRKAGSWA